MTKINFFDYWDSFGLFDNIQHMLPQQFLILFEIARVLYTNEKTDGASSAIEEISSDETINQTKREDNPDLNRIFREAPLSNKLEIENYKTIHDLKKAIPRELALDDDVFNAKLFTKSLLVQKFYESQHDEITPITTAYDKSDKNANQFDQKFYILLDKSRSMDRNMRSFYSKCIVAEFLKRKLRTRARLFFRTFDSKPGKLFCINKHSDFPVLLEEVLLTTTGGSSTNIQSAVFQAVDDIKYDKELQKAEILVVTDGISKIDANRLKDKLGDIKLNILKIGVEPNISDIYDIRAQMKDVAYKHQSRFDMDDNDRYLSNKLFDDLASVSKRFIEIDDLNRKALYTIDEQSIEDLQKWINESNKLNLDRIMLGEKVKLYKQAYLLSQYLGLLIKHKHVNEIILKKMLGQLLVLKQNLLKYPDVLYLIEGMDNLEQDQFIMKKAQKAMVNLTGDTVLSSSPLTFDTIRKTKLALTSEKGSGKGKSFFVVLIVKMIEMVRSRMLQSIVRRFKS